jgi:hypothetical protein
VGDVLGVLAVVGFFAGTMAGLAWLGRRARRRAGGRAGAALIGPLEEMWHPAAHRARTEIETVEERAESMPTPDDPLGRGPTG